MDSKESVWELVTSLRTCSFSTIDIKTDQYGSVNISIVGPDGVGVYTIVTPDEMGILLTNLGNSMTQAYQKRVERDQKATLEYDKRRRT